MKTLAILLSLTLVSCVTLLQATQLVWTPDPTEAQAGVTNHFVYAAPAGTTNFALIGQAAGSSFVLTKPAFGTVYYVTAVAPQGESDPSNLATNMIPGAPILHIQKP